VLAEIDFQRLTPASQRYVFHDASPERWISVDA
jgi:hypothetical protein